MKIKIMFLLILSVFYPLHAHDIFNHIDLKEEAVVLINATNGRILFEKNKDLTIFPASITKIATALFILKKKSFSPNSLIKIKKEALQQISSKDKKDSGYRSPAYWLEPEGSSIELRVGEELSAKDLFSAMLVSSANDAANVLAHYYGPTIPVFLKELNIYLKELGCKNTSFLNPHGLHHPAHISTIEDLALITREALKEPLFQEIVKLKKHIVHLSDGSEKCVCYQTNRLLKKGSFFYPKAYGVKTGTTKMAGKNLVAAAKSNNRDLIAIGMGCRTDLFYLYQNIIKLFEITFNEPLQRCILLDPGKQVFTTKVKGGRKKLITTLPKGLFYDFYRSEPYTPIVSLTWDIPTLPIKTNSIVGTLIIKDKDSPEIIKQQPLFAAADVPPNLIFQCFSFAKKHPIWFALCNITLLAVLTGKKFKNHRSKKIRNFQH
ncbi:D-alanyl-D-alanine carboxypeptidase family protein [Candidatus Clavichlamydia salmonicola]|uniref:D-alanyl-D-alanine carboxypeptidase family protein n=1 Tax=Candidatus Clavichlamydia salmonicola TaxID=469812 RepID=UPI0018917BF5|nr:D-alanyl-D-alanine carboxypeptidase family protein [Candidatus Clavichlamydia salmonicola]